MLAGIKKAAIGVAAFLKNTFNEFKVTENTLYINTSAILPRNQYISRTHLSKYLNIFCCFY